ncbi:hypothetical protein FOA52_000654 [Chlamydomonas sp. UWO 241]|nr:hypothetical protein FOA52_000654 [Chlamydomonas sp. UWO 241]
MGTQDAEIAVCYEAIDGLYIGSLRSLGKVAMLGITHVLSAVNFTITSELGGRPHHVCPLRDEVGESLLPHLPDAVAFIAGALDGGGKVLVHCQAGQSRSAAVALAFIMKARGLGAQEALNLVQSKSSAAGGEGACPNEGFWGQLLLFQDMRCRLDESHPVYRMWCLEQVGKRWEEDGWVDGDTFAVVPGDAELRAGLEQAAYRCRKCRTCVCTQSHVLPVEAAIGHRMFRNFWQLRQAPGKEGPTPNTNAGPASLFVEPLSWMASTVTGEVQGKLYCPGQGCSNKLGAFNWSGISNEAGAWVTPAFQLHGSKLDKIEPPRAIAQITQIRTPVFVPRPALGGPPRSQPALDAAPGSAQESESVPATGATAGAAPAPAPGLATVSEPGPAAATSPGEEGPSSSSAPRGQPSLPDTLTHLVLDCDGVLVDSERASCESLRRAILQATGFDIPHDFPTDFYPVFGMDVRGCVEHYAGAHGKTEWDVEEVARQVLAAKDGIYKELTAGGIEAFSGASDVIMAAQAMGLSVGIASSGAPEKIKHNLCSSGLWGLIDESLIVSASHVARGKPFPDVYVEALRRLGCTDPSTAFVVEDAVNGLKAGKGAGAFTVAVCTSLPRERLEGHADVVCESLEEVVGMLGRLRDARAAAAATAAAVAGQN